MPLATQRWRVTRTNEHNEEEKKGEAENWSESYFDHDAWIEKRRSDTEKLRGVSSELLKMDHESRQALEDGRTSRRLQEVTGTEPMKEFTVHSETDVGDLVVDDDDDDARWTDDDAQYGKHAHANDDVPMDGTEGEGVDDDESANTMDDYYSGEGNGHTTTDDLYPNYRHDDYYLEEERRSKTFVALDPHVLNAPAFVD
mmetsp:Transcript_8114/g.10155  ORF Transcript_8114/g.10155 Transcript_8114/m.10155 type:complete len:199 (-) Transcript_8114:141-737(-)